MSSQSVKSEQKPNLVKEQITTSSKKDLSFQNFMYFMQKYQQLFRVSLVFILIGSAYIFHKVYIFQTHPHFESIREGNIYEMLLYGIPYALIFFIAEWILHYYLDDYYEKYVITEQRYLDPQSRKKRCYTLVKWSYSTVYYIVTSFWAYTILRETTFMPTWLGGKGSPYTYLYQNSPKVADVTLEMKIYYISQFGKHFSRFFGHVFIRPEGNFFEYALHHGLSIFLIMFSFLTNQWLIGILVLLLHDYSDFALISARAYKDYKHPNKILSNISYVHAFFGWVICRIFLFITCCIAPAFYQLLITDFLTKFTEFEYNILCPIYAFLIGMMICLEFLHIFWTYYIAESFIAGKVSAKVARHSYD